MREKIFLILFFVFFSCLASAEISLDWIYPSNSINVSQNNFFNITVNVSCSGADCGGINVTLDPIWGSYELNTIAYQWENCNATTNSTKVVTSADDTYGSVNLPFSFPFYNNTYTSVYLTSNGNIDFDTAANQCCDQNASYHMGKNEIHMDKADGRTDTGAAGRGVYICNKTGYVIIQYEGGYYGCSGNQKWQAVLYPNGQIYAIYNQTTTSCGITNVSGMSGVNGSDYVNWVEQDGAAFQLCRGSCGKGIVNTTIGASPFYTNATNNPWAVNLNNSQSQILVFHINATGTKDTSYTFFVYTNQTSNMSINNKTSSLNITIKDMTAPAISITYPVLNANYDFNLTQLNYSYYDFNGAGLCWHSNSSGVSNSSSISSTQNFTNALSIEGNNNWTLYCNDTSGNLNSTSIAFLRQTPGIGLSLVFPLANINITKSQFFQIIINVSCSNNNCGAINVSLANLTTRISTTAGTLPFYTNVTNPYNLTLNVNQSAIITFFVNASGTAGLNHTFFVYANRTAELSNTNITSRFNISIVNFAVEYNAPIVTLISPLNNYGNLNNITFSYNVSDESNVTNCSLIFNSAVNQINLSINKTITQSFIMSNLGVGSYNWSINCTDSHSNTGKSDFRKAIVIKLYTFPGLTTNLSQINVVNVTNFVVDNPNYGTINFSESLDLSSGADIDSYINISFNKISLDSSNLPSLNKQARLKLYNLTFNNPEILKDNSVCSSCTKESYSSGTLTFNVPGFSVYSAREISESSPSSGGGGSSGKIYECFLDQDCKKSYVCYNNKCVKLFDIKILSFKSPANTKDYFNFTYFMKGMAEINSDVIVNFWLEKYGEKVSEGRDTIYLRSFDEKTETTSLFLPGSIKAGNYRFYIEINYESYRATSFRDIEIIEKEENIKIIDLAEKEEYGNLIVIIIIILLVIIVAGINKYLPKLMQKDIPKEKIEKLLLENSLIKKPEVSKRVVIPENFEKIAEKVLETTAETNADLSESQKNVLTLLNKVEKEKAIAFIQNYLPYSDYQIEEIITNLENKGLLKVIKISQNQAEVEKYYYTEKVTPQMLNDNLRFKKDYGWDYQ